MKTLFPRMPDLIPAMVEQLGSRQVKRMCDIFLVFPAVVMMVACGFYLALWRVDPFVRFAHMVWVLGFWMLGSMGMFGCIIPARLKLGFPLQIMIFASIRFSLPSISPLYPDLLPCSQIHQDCSCLRQLAS